MYIYWELYTEKHFVTQRWTKGILWHILYNSQGILFMLTTALLLSEDNFFLYWSYNALDIHRHNTISVSRTISLDFG
jgi:hypothetical protein